MSSTESASEHPLRFTWKVSLYNPEKKSKPSQSLDAWMKNIHAICHVKTLEDFWGMCHNIPRPSLLPPDSSYYIFKDGIDPAWEHPQNRGGGRIYISLKTSAMRQQGEILYFDLLLLIIGNQLSSADYINGTIYAKDKEKIEIWVAKEAKESEMRQSIISILNEILTLKSAVFRLKDEDVTYKPHPNK